MASSAFLVMAASALSVLLGFGREITTAHYYGMRSEVDAFLNASTIPIVIFGVFHGALVSALVPTFSEYFSLGGRDALRKFGSTVINALLLVMSGVAALGWLLAPLFVAVIGHGFSRDEQNLEVQMVRCLMPGVIATAVSGVCAALLNTNHRFLASALIQVAANVVTIGFVVVLQRELGIFALVLGTVVGLFAQLLVQIPSILRDRLYQFELDWRHPGLVTSWALLVPVFVGSGATSVNIAFDRFFASTLDAGSTAGLSYSTKLVGLPSLIVAGAIATVTFPLIAGQFVSANRGGIRRTVSLAVRMVSFIVVPCAVGMSVLAYPIVQTLFERGAFGQADTVFCASLIPFACLTLIATSYNAVIGRACYACKEIRLAVVGAICAVAINIAFSAALLPTLGARGLLLANGIGSLVGLVFLTALLWRLINGLDWQPIISSLFRVALASFVMAGALYWIQSLGFVPASTFSSRAWYLTGLLGIGTAVFLGAARVLGVEELTIATRMLRRQFMRGTVTAENGNATTV